MKLDWSILWQNWPAFTQGVGITILLTVLTMAVAVPAGIGIAMVRLSTARIPSFLAACYVELFRSLPLILVVYWAFYVLPVVTNIALPAFLTGLAALCLNVSAYNAETFRAGIASIRSGQSEAALALGMSPLQTYRVVVLPQAWRRVLPVLASTWVSLFKDTSLVSVIAVGDLAYTALRIRSQSFRVLEVLTAMAVLYWMLGYPQAKLADWVQRRFGVVE